MHKIISILFLGGLFVCMFGMPAVSQTGYDGPVTVEQMVFCTEVENRTPVDAASVFPDTVGRVFCFTRVASALEETAVSHVWYFNDVQMAIVDLPVCGHTWRTWSSKRIVSEWTGAWRVDVIASDGSVICSDAFVVNADSD